MSSNNREYGSAIHHSDNVQAPKTLINQSIDNDLSPSMQSLLLSKRRTEQSISESTGVKSPLRKLRTTLFDPVSLFDGFSLYLVSILIPVYSE
jgi:hypothetical protein